ncbi:MAG TPA: right-handed parallel beta-helix repeat-containing protein [Bryobacteraceae bacterium]|jgi:hypothetical protein|nr:right-handed parallel beta-helix repeat-containing protein [Bryobacteraceae bacterium]
MKKNFLILTVILAAPAGATVYYADRANGSDLASGQSPDQAWQTLARAAAQQLQPGDSVLLKRGDVWHEPLIFESSGAPLAPVTIGAYGDAADPAPAIDGTGVASAASTGLLKAHNLHDVVITAIIVRNSSGAGINIYGGTGIRIRDVIVTGSKTFGILVYNSNDVTIEDSQIFGNALDTTASWDGIRIDGDANTYHRFLIRNNSIHHQIGGTGWNSANGIFLGHTSPDFTTLQDVRIAGNDVYANGNPAQNQAGRGITGTFHGDVKITGNYIHENASAGLYLGNEGMRLDILLENNTFYDNALRQYGGYTATRAYARRNLVLVDSPAITAMGVEIGGSGSWRIEQNTFCYLTPTADTFRGYIRLNDSATQPGLISNHNMFYSVTPLAWVLPSGTRLTFSQWQSLGFDLESQNPQ